MFRVNIILHTLLWSATDMAQIYWHRNVISKYFCQNANMCSFEEISKINLDIDLALIKTYAQDMWVMSFILLWLCVIYNVSVSHKNTSLSTFS